MDEKSILLLDYSEIVKKAQKKLVEDNSDMSLKYYEEHYKDKNFDKDAWMNKFAEFFMVAIKLSMEKLKIEQELYNRMQTEAYREYEEYQKRVSNNRHED